MIFQIAIVHFSILLIVFILIIIGVLIARLLKGKKNWFFTGHKILEIIAIILAIIAVSITGFNFSVGLHAYIGLVTLIGLIIVLFIGFYYDYLKPNTEAEIQKKKKVRKIHIILSTIFTLLMIFQLMTVLIYI
jgi:cytochrome b561